MGVVNPAAPVLRGEVYGVNLDPTVGTEIQKTRPGLVVSPDGMNAALPWVIVAPVTRAGRPKGRRPKVMLLGKNARILLDQLRCVDKRRPGPKMGQIDPSVWHSVRWELLA